MSFGFLNKLKCSDGSCENQKCCKVKCALSVVLISAITSIIVCKIANRGGDISKQIRDEIYKDPKFIIDALQKMEREEQKKAQEQAAKKAPEVAQKIKDRNLAVIGNKNASKVVIEFFDYSCGHCKRQANELKKLIANGDVKVILVDMPFLSRGSVVASQVGMYIALNNPSKLEKYYEEVSSKNTTNETIKSVIKNLGLPANYFDKAIKDKKVQEEISRNFEFSREVGIQGTPALIINDKLVNGSSFEEMKAMLNK